MFSQPGHRPLPTGLSRGLSSGLATIVLAAPALAAPQNAATPDSFFQKMPGSPTPASQEAPRAVEWAEVTDDSVIDVAILQQSQLRIMANAGFVETSIIVPGHFNDVVGLTRSGRHLDRDLLTVGALGLRQIRWSEVDGAFVKDHAMANTADNGPWQYATILRTGNLGGTTADQDVLGLAVGGTTILKATWNGTAYVPAPFPAAFTGTVLDIATANLTGGPHDEVLVVTTDGVFRFDEAGVEIGAMSPLTSVAGELETVDRGDGLYERVAWLRTAAGAGTSLLLLDSLNPNAPAISQTIPFPNPAPRTLDAGDYFGNGRTDLALGGEDGDIVPVLRQNGAGLFAHGRNLYVQDPAALPQPARPLLVDFDSDGDLDMITPVPAQDMLFMGRNDAVSHRSVSPRILTTFGDPSSSDQIWFSGTLASPSPTTDLTIHIRFAAPTDPTIPQADQPAYFTHNPPTGANGIEVKLWRSTQQANRSYLTESAPVASRLVLFNAPYDDEDAQTSFLQASMPYFQGPGLNTTIHYLTTRYVEVQNGETVRGWAHRSRALAEGGTPAKASLEGAPFSLGDPQDFDFDDPWQAPDPSIQIPVDGTTPGGGPIAGCVSGVPQDEVPEDKKPTDVVNSKPPAPSKGTE